MVKGTERRAAEIQGHCAFAPLRRAQGLGGGGQSFRSTTKSSSTSVQNLWHLNTRHSSSMSCPARPTTHHAALLQPIIPTTRRTGLSIMCPKSHCDGVAVRNADDSTCDNVKGRE